MLVQSGVPIDDADREELRVQAQPPGAVDLGCAAVPLGAVLGGVLLVALGVWGLLVAPGALALLAGVTVALGAGLLLWAAVFTRAARKGGMLTLQPDTDAVAALQRGTIAVSQIIAEAAWLVEQGICDDDLRTTVVRVGPARFVVLPHPPGYAEQGERTWRSKPLRTIDSRSEIRWVPRADGGLDWLRQSPLPGSAPLALRAGLPSLDDEQLDALHEMGQRPREVGLDDLPGEWRSVLAES